MTLVVTGGAGFIGSHFVRNWLDCKDEHVVVLDKLTYAGHWASLSDVRDDPRLLCIHGDITDSTLVEQILRDHAPRAIVNFAAESHVDRSICSPEDFIQTNIVGTYRMLETTRHWWDNLAPPTRAAFRFLQVSTDEVFGSLSPTDPAAPENHPYAPNNPYSASKAAADHLARSYFQTYDLPVITSRCSNNYGPYQFPEKFIPRMITRALRGETLPLYGDGQHIRDWIHVRDHCHALRLLLEHGHCGETYNIGGTNEKTNLEVVYTLCDILDRATPKTDGTSYRSQIEFVPDRQGHDRRYGLDSTKIMTLCGWTPSVSFDAGIATTIDWYSDHTDWVHRVLRLE